MQVDLQVGARIYAHAGETLEDVLGLPPQKLLMHHVVVVYAFTRLT